MCSSPSRPGTISTNAPNVTTLRTLPWYTRPGLRILGDVADHLLGAAAALAVDRGDAHLARVLDVDLGAGLLGDALDDLAARTDDLADLVGVDVRMMMRGAYGDISARGARQRLLHDVEDDAAARCARARARPRSTSNEMPPILVSIWNAVTPSRVPVTLKSMSPR